MIQSMTGYAAVSGEFARGAIHIELRSVNSRFLDVQFRIAEELRRQYNIGYYPSDTGQAGQRKQIKVRVDRPNLVVRARDSYIVGGTDKPQTTTSSKFNFK